MSFKLMKPNGSGVISDEEFNPYIYPNTGYIPYCKQCLTNFEAFKSIDKEVEMEHSPACLWYDYYIGKIRQINPKAKIVRTKHSK